MLQIPQKYFFESDSKYLNNDGILYFCKVIKEELKKTYFHEKSLFSNKTSEDTLKFAFALRLISRINHDSTFEDHCVEYYIDQNYNRLVTGMKYVEGQIYNYPESFTPSRRLFDLVVHRRGEFNGYPENLIHFEFKGTGSVSTRFINNDLLRLQKTTQNRLVREIVQKGYYSDGIHKYIGGYQLGIFIKFVNNIDAGRLIVFVNGETVENILNGGC